MEILDSIDDNISYKVMHSLDFINYDMSEENKAKLIE